MLISVIMPVYNAERYVAQAVESILSQTYSDFEFIIVDDGSTDETPMILTRYQERDSRIRIITNKNSGLAQALNQGIAAARGKYVARMDADDNSLPNRFFEQVNYLEANPVCIALGTRVITFTDEVIVAEQFLLTRHEEIDAANLAGECSIAHSSVMMRRTVLVETGGYRKEFGEDLDLWLRLAEAGRLANLSSPLLKYRVHVGSLSYNKLYQDREIMQEILSEAFQRRGITRKPPKVRLFRMPTDPSLLDALLSRMALMAGNYGGARFLALRSIRRTPLSVSKLATLGLAFAGMLGRMLLMLRSQQLKLSH